MKTKSSVLLGPNRISEILKVYKPEHIYVSEAAYEAGVIRGVFRRPPYPYASSKVSYLPAANAVLLLNQLGYLHGACLINDPEIDTPISLDVYLELMLAHQVVYKLLEFDFREFIPNEDGMYATIALKRIGCHFNTLMIQSEVNFNDKMHGRTLVAIATDKRFRRR